MRVLYYSRVIGGRLIGEAATDAIRSYEGKDVQFSIEPTKRGRSNRQNKYMHWCFEKIAECLRLEGNDIDSEQVKHMLKEEFLCETRTLPGDKYLRVTKRTRDLSTMELERFMEQVRAWAVTEFQIALPLPNEQMGFEYDEPQQ